MGMSMVLPILMIVTFVLTLRALVGGGAAPSHSKILELRPQISFSCLGPVVLDVHPSSRAGGRFNDTGYSL